MDKSTSRMSDQHRILDALAGFVDRELGGVGFVMVLASDLDGEQQAVNVVSNVDEEATQYLLAAAAKAIDSSNIVFQKEPHNGETH